MYRNIQVQGDADALFRSLGYVPERRLYRVLLPVVSPVTDDVITVLPAGDETAAPPAPPVLVRWLVDNLPKFDVPANVPTLTSEQLARRMAVMPERPQQRSFDFFGEGKLVDDECFEHVRAAYGFPTNLTRTLYPFDGEGGKLDAAHDHAVFQAEVAAQRARQQAEEAARLNDKPLSELGLIAIYVPRGGRKPPTDRVFAAGTTLVERMTDATVAVEDDDGNRTWLFRAPSLPVAQGRIPKSDAVVLSSDWVPPLRRGELAAKTIVAPLQALLGLRRLPATPVDPTRVRDGRTPEGAHAEKLFRAAVESDAATLAPSEASFGWKLFAQKGVRGFLLEPNVVLAVLRERLPMVPGPIVTVSRFFTEDGDEVPANQVQLVPPTYAGGGRPYRVLGRVRSSLNWAGGHADPEGVTQVEYLREHTHEELGPMVRAGDGELVREVQEALAGRTPWVDLDELYTPPPETFLARWARRVFGNDGAWLEVLREVSANRDFIPTEDIARALIERGVIATKRATNADYTKIRKLMTSDGWTYRQVPTEHGRERRWCRS